MFNNNFHNNQFQTIIPPPPLSWSWEALMVEAIKEAELAYLEDEVPIGAIVVNKKGNIISKAHNRNINDKDPCAHAEILAIQKACASLSTTHLSECILVVTLEPCLMCAAAISLSSLDGIVFGAWNKHSGAIVSQNDFINLPLNSNKIWYMGGVAANLCVEILQKFFTSLRVYKDKVIMI